MAAHLVSGFTLRRAEQKKTVETPWVETFREGWRCTLPSACGFNTDRAELLWVDVNVSQVNLFRP